MPLQEGQGLLRDRVVAVAAAHHGRTGPGAARLLAHAVGQRDLLRVAMQVFRIVEVRAPLVVVTEEVLEPVARGNALGVLSAEPPLAEDAGGVALLSEDVGHGRDVVRQRLLAGGMLLVPADVRVARVLAGHERAARRRAHGTSGLELREPRSLSRHEVQPRRPDLRLAVGADVPVAEVVRHDEDDVGRARVGPRGHSEEHRQGQAGPPPTRHAA